MRTPVTRKQLKEMQLDDAVIEEIIAAHAATVEALKAERDAALSAAAALLREGRLVAFPTETVYGLGADALNEEAVAAIFAAKGRPGDNPLIVHVAEKSQLDELCEVTADTKKLMDAFWPGPLTILLKKKPAVPDEDMV